MQTFDNLLNIEDFGELYVTIQQSNLFSDSKFFVDAIPVDSVEQIIHSYQSQKNSTNFNLLSFIKTHFKLPNDSTLHYHSDNKDITTNIQDLWEVLTQQPGEKGGTLIPLPYPYIIPGGRFREIYYWDSYFTMLGLSVDRRWDIIENMIKNFSYLINTFGHIPNGNRTYYLSRSQPPFFCLMVELLAAKKGTHILLDYLPTIEKEYAYWMDGADQLSEIQSTYRRVVLLENGAVLNRYWDDDDTPRPEAYKEDTHLAQQVAGATANEIYRHIRAAAESGWDFSSRWFTDAQNMATIETTHIIPVDLNCLLLFIEETLANIYNGTGHTNKANLFIQKSTKRKEAIRQFCWNEEKGFYFDYQFIKKQQKTVYSLAALYPLFFSITSKEDAAKVVAITAEKFLQQGGAVTTTLHSGQQWDAPNGWAPLQWITYKGLKNYQENHLAHQLKENWLLLNETVYRNTGKLMEKYNVETSGIHAGGGEYPTQDGFGWTNGIFLALKNDD
ncbi:alpha,alpha-trehalase TreA [Hydrotalea sp.]|uniref:alpha,alpha-trehalase TreA n=1 Tax=Hydrotalea sp. TaxID=2881279 RepID=UPI00258A0F51|nr:alpha,alpha-trehalase TreA [Hydrotalea sp.]